jgi:CHASE2 domain-containing sensor protein
MRWLRQFFSFDNLMITLATIGVIAALLIIPSNVQFLSPVQQALGDFELTDMVFSKFRDESTVTVDSSIVLVNIGTLSRDEIAALIEIIVQQQPRVVGIDAFFRSPKDSAADARLARAIGLLPRCVMATKCAFREESKEGVVDQWTPSSVDDDREFDTLEQSMPLLMLNAVGGFVNVIVDQEASFMTCRSISFEEVVDNKTQHSFAIECARAVNPAAVQQALARNNGEEIINYRGNVGSYYHLDYDEILNPESDLSVMRNKIVVLGFLGNTLLQRSLEDVFFTPLNEQYVGRSYPDMYGVVIHANTISMILQGTYISSMETWQGIVIAVILLMFNAWLFSILYEKAEQWYDTIALALQLGQSVLILYLTIFLFDTYSYRADLTPALATVAFVGTVHDLYHDSLKKLWLQMMAWLARLWKRG